MIAIAITLFFAHIIENKSIEVKWIFVINLALIEVITIDFSSKTDARGKLFTKFSEI